MSRYSRSNESNSLVTLQCGCGLVIVVFNLLAGGWSVNYLLMTLAGKTIPFFWATIIGLFFGEFSIPAALLTAVLRHFGVL
jgi:hypothetical protein